MTHRFILQNLYKKQYNRPVPVDHTTDYRPKGIDTMPLSVEPDPIHGGLQYQITCEYCWQPIDHISQGQCTWAVHTRSGKPVNGFLAFIHRRCFSNYIHTNPVQGGYWQENSLEVFLLRLGSDLGVDWQRTLERKDVLCVPSSGAEPGI